MRRFLLPCKHGKESPNKEEYKASIPLYSVILCHVCRAKNHRIKRNTRLVLIRAGTANRSGITFLTAVSESIADEGADEAMEFGVWLDEHLPLHQADPGDDTNHIISATCRWFIQSKTVQLYVRQLDQPNAPLRSLVGLEKVFVPAGTTVQVGASASTRHWASSTIIRLSTVDF